MTALIIIAVIALLFFVLLASSITIHFEYDKIFKFKINYLFFTIAKDPLSPKEQKKKQRKEEKKKRKEEKKKQKAAKTTSVSPKNKDEPTSKTDTAAKAENETNTEENQKTNDENKASAPKPKKEKKKSGITPDLIMRILGKAKPHIKRLFKKIRITGVYVDIAVGGEDAAKTAISYGTHCAAIYGLVSFLDNTITFKAEKIGIRADFQAEKSEYYAKGTVKLRVSTLLHSGIWGFMAVRNELMQITKATEKTPDESADKAA